MADEVPLVYPADVWFKKVNPVKAWYAEPVTNTIQAKTANNYYMGSSVTTVKEAVGYEQYTYYLAWTT